MAMRIGPFSTGAIMKMAGLAKEYHPAQVLPRLARETDRRGRVLHSAWISGLADAAIRAVAPSTKVTALKICHENPAFESDTLTIEVTLAGEDRGGEVKVFSFAIFNGRKRRIASGTARVRT
ncbi:MAG: hypothetical protein HY914_08170 [Desulfomonile tiedjei]|nr:hypothetical protein [Desulfomonile tiedjei]